VGLSGPKKNWRGLTAVDVSHHFGFFVHTNYRNVLEKIMIDHRKTYNATPGETVTAVFTEPEESEVLGRNSEPEADLVWTTESESLILSKFENEISTYEKTHEVEMGGKATQKIEGKQEETKGEKKAEGMQAMVEESVQKLGHALKESAELLQVGKDFLQNVKVLLENRKNILDQAKNLAGVVLESVPLGKKEK
jgi:hypothetical protein